MLSLVKRIVRKSIDVVATSIGNLYIHKYYDQTFSLDNVFVIFSAPRGGSTWLTELIKNNMDAHICWEPLNPKQGVVGGEFGDRPSYKAGYAPKLFKQLEEIFAGKRVNTWTFSKSAHTYRAAKEKHEKLLIKFVRANRLLPELTNRFDFKNRPILLLRHPMAVVDSRRKRFRSLNNDHFNWDEETLKHRSYVDSLEGSFEKELAFYFAIHKDDYNAADSLGCIVVHYEDLLTRPEETITRIFSEWRLKVKEVGSYRRASSTSSASGTIMPKDQLGKWRQHFTAEQLGRFQEIFDHYAVRLYSVHEDYPLDAQER